MHASTEIIVATRKLKFIWSLSFFKMSVLGALDSKTKQYTSIHDAIGGMSRLR